jgi:fatty acid CoA ligase FadD36
MSLLPALDGRFGDHDVAVSVAGEGLSWSELAARADAVGGRIRGASAVAVSGASTLDTVIAVVAGLRSGVPVVPVPSDAGPMERSHVLRDSGAELVLGDPDWPDVSLPRVSLAPGAAGASAAAPFDGSDEAPALIMYTSGTTGLPKGAVLPRRAIASCLDGLAAAWEWTPNDHLVQGLPLFHVHGLILGVLGPLRVGSRLTHTGRPLPSLYAEANGSMYFGVPTVWGRVVGEPDAARALRSARLLVSGSAPLPVPVFEQLAALTGHLPIERYGMTETLITITTRASGERRPGFVGLPIDGVETRLVADDKSPVVTDGESIGELYVRGATVFSHYLNNPDATTGSFDDDWFCTGDAATIGPDRFHRIVGRKSTDIIKSGGYKIGAGEVEAALLAHPAVREAAVIGVADDDLGQCVVGFVVAEGVDGRELTNFVGSMLSGHKRPRRVHVVAELPRNAMGKVQKKKLVEP